MLHALHQQPLLPHAPGVLGELGTTLDVESDAAHFRLVLDIEPLQRYRILHRVREVRRLHDGLLGDLNIEVFQ